MYELLDEVMDHGYPQILDSDLFGIVSVFEKYDIWTAFLMTKNIIQMIKTSFESRYLNNINFKFFELCNAAKKIF